MRYVPVVGASFCSAQPEVSGSSPVSGRQGVFPPHRRADETPFLSWLEFEMLLRRLEERVENPGSISFKRQYAKEEPKEYQVSIRSHYRYRDFSILNATATLKNK
jgi:hypothetical protein